VQTVISLIYLEMIFELTVLLKRKKNLLIDCLQAFISEISNCMFRMGTAPLQCVQNAAARVTVGLSSPCPPGTEGAPMATSHLLDPVQGGIRDVYGVTCTWKNPLHLPVAIRHDNIVVPPTTRLHCSTDTNQVRSPSLFCCRSDCLQQSPGVRQIDEDCCQS